MKFHGGRIWSSRRPWRLRRAKSSIPEQARDETPVGEAKEGGAKVGELLLRWLWESWRGEAEFGRWPCCLGWLPEEEKEEEERRAGEDTAAARQQPTQLAA